MVNFQVLISVCIFYTALPFLDILEINSYYNYEICVVSYSVWLIDIEVLGLERASGEFHDGNSVPECKKYHTLAHKFKNLFLPCPIDK